jgi:hypothetical protein
VRRFRFRALVTLAPAEPCNGAPYGSSRQYSGHTVALVILAPLLRGGDGQARFFPTEIWWDGEAPPGPGHHALVTVRVTDDHAGDFLDAGQRFTIWFRGQVGHGIVCSGLFAD